MDPNKTFIFTVAPSAPSPKASSIEVMRSRLARAYDTSSTWWTRAVVTATGPVVRWHERAKLRLRDPALVQHQELREEARQLVTVLSQLGYRHRKAPTQLLAGGLMLVALERSMPASISEAEKEQTLSTRKSLEFELRRLRNEGEQ